MDHGNKVLLVGPGCKFRHHTPIFLMNGLRSYNIIKYFAIRNDRCGRFITRGFYRQYIYLHPISSLETKAKVKEILLFALKLLFRFAVILLLFLLLVGGLLQIPKVQTTLTGYITEAISSKTGYSTSIRAVNIRWWDAISLSDVEIYDLEDSLMVDLEEVYIDFSIRGLLDANNPGFDEINLREGNVRLLTHDTVVGMNITDFVDRIGLLVKTRKTDPERKPVRFNISNIAFEKTSLDMIDYTLAETEVPFDYGRLRFRDLIASASDFVVVADTVAFDLRFLQGIESTSGIAFQQLRTNFTYSSLGMEFNDLYLKANDTEIKNYLRFSYEDVDALRNFNEEVEVFAQLDETVLDIQDLRFFAKTFPQVQDKVYLSGEVSGKISDLFSEELLLRFGERSALFGKFSIQGLPLLDSTYFNLSLVNSSLSSRDLIPYTNAQAQKELDKFANIRFDSDFSGYLNKFRAEGDFRTGIGRLKGSIDYLLNGLTPTYRGRVEAMDFDIGKLFEDPELFQRTSFKGNVKGRGISASSAILELDADIRYIGINNYEYKGITTNATLGRDLFKGKLSVNDPNLVMEVDGTLDLRNGKDSANLVMKLDTAYLQPLLLAENNIFLSGSFELDTKGLHWDNVEGVTRFRDVLVSYEGRDLFIDYFLFQSLFTDDSRVISLNSDVLVASIAGNFKVDELIKDSKELWEDYLAIITNEPPKTRVYAEDHTYYIDITLDLRDPDPLINLFDPSLSISANTSLEGAFFQTPENTVFNLFAEIDSIYYLGHYFFDNEIDFNTSKIKNSSEVLAAFYVYSNSLELRSGLNFNHLMAEAIWDESKVTLDLGLDQLATDSYVKLGSNVTLAPGSTTIHFEPSRIKLLENFWEFNPDNRIHISPQEIAFDNLKLFHENQFISANGKINPETGEMITVDIHELSLDFLNSFGLKNYQGIANGEINLADYRQKKGSYGKLRIEDIHINDFLIGDLEAHGRYEEGMILVDVENFRNGNKAISIKGGIRDQDQSMDLKADFENTNLIILEPFIGEYVSRLGGSLSGSLDIRGNLGSPSLQGKGQLQEGRFTFNYLGTSYELDGQVMFEPNEINFRNLSIKDVNSNRATLRGGISHDNFSNFILDISSTYSNFQVMNTTLADNELFYGTAYATGSLEVFGSLDNLELNANAISQPNTRVFIPIGSTQGQVQEDFIRIINVRDTTSNGEEAELAERLNIRNLNMNFNLDLNPNAYVEIQIDPRTGENIQGRGRGVLNLQVDTQGNFSMSGTYEIVDALYNFSLYNVINKRFQIEPGGRVSWFGDPYEGIMNIRAAYEENVSLISLQTTPEGSEFETAELKRRYPVKVIMDLDGPLLSPDISFAFNFSAFPESSEVQTTISAFQNRIANDEQEKNRQVFSLIMLRRFSPEGQFTGSGIGFSNLSQLVSSQLNSLIAQVDQNLEIDFDLTTLDETALETFQLRVAYTFMDGRLRVTRDGGFTDLQGNADFNTIAGDWQAEYLLTEDGRYRVRVYNRNNFNTLTALNINNRAPNTYGVSVSQNLNFSSFRELFQNITRRNQPQLLRDDDDFLRYDFNINLDEVAPDLFKPEPELEERPSIQILDATPSPYKR